MADLRDSNASTLEHGEGDDNNTHLQVFVPVANGGIETGRYFSGTCQYGDEKGKRTIDGKHRAWKN